MAEAGFLHIAGMASTLLLIMIIGVNSGKNIKNSSDFTTGGKSASTSLVAGALISTLIGGSSTIGTAQLAYSYGMSAWWFTLGSGLGCLLFGLFFVKPFRNSGCITIQQVISHEYGNFAGVVASVLSSFGIVLNIVAQILSANALLTAVFGIRPVLSAAITVAIMICYVVFGGVLGTGILGNVKLVLTYIAVGFGTYKILTLSGGFTPIYNALPKEQYFNMFARGFGIDIGSLVSVILGVLCGQTYVQTILSGRNDIDAKKATVAAALLLPPVGLGAVFIGMYMKINYPLIESSQAFPIFVLENMPPLLGGAVLATLLLALVGTGSGMALGFGTIVSKDIYKKFIRKDADGKKELLVSRIFIVLSFLISAAIVSINKQTAILTWGFLATGLRGTVLLFPMLGALFFKDKIDHRFAVASSIGGITAHLTCELFFELSFDSLFAGVGVGFIIFAVGAIVKKFSR
ncbi:MAG: sodium:solute symporter family protein [Sedimentibacter saalensis]|jgi:SSS family solute:Na+ symporter|uniref:sodium:solute symporter family protein n=1 Tax=Sedimentibacter saalensis TaxID=130788 RepID=UPI002B1FB01C|nr:sodium:solute symporter family protein [Sedimentibacter saalensis]MEA5095307.1 sodium:solute symporter family protein [Sedimentibacter saalensis]